jgi:repressor LexA
VKEVDLTIKQLQALRLIRNSIIYRSKSPSIRELQEGLGYSSPRSAALILEALIKSGRVERRPDGSLRILIDLADEDSHARTINVPLLGAAACGIPMLAEENFEAMIPVSVKLARPPYRYFLLRAKGDSMDRANISDGDLVLVRQQTSAENGDIVVALIDDEATIKEFWRASSTVLLKPNSNSREHQPIILSNNFQIQGVVITAIPRAGLVHC